MQVTFVMNIKHDISMNFYTTLEYIRTAFKIEVVQHYVWT